MLPFVGALPPFLPVRLLIGVLAGLPLSRVRGSNTSVYAGCWSHEYHEGMIRDEDNLPRFLPIGTLTAMSSNRISHFFDLRGPSATVDTGCSTALVALHQAVNSLRLREADMSVISAGNLLLGPDMFKIFSSLGMLSADGRCFAFDSRANGFGRGEGVATIVIKRLNDALACGDPVRAIIRETCLNEDGKTETITTPSQAAQEELMHECYRRAGLDPRETQYFEAHGTGTPTGDPIEARSIGAVFGGASRKEPLRVGSVKTNIGHTEATSGLASVIKVVLAMEHGQIPPSVNYKMPNPKLSFAEWGLAHSSTLEQWPVSTPSQALRASVNNFGFGGSNSHVILEGVNSLVPSTQNLTNGVNAHDDSTVLVLSAQNEKSCQRMVSNLKEYLQSHSKVDASELMRNLSYTLGERRTLFPWVAAQQVRLNGNSLDSVIQALDSPGFKPVRTGTRRPRIGMVFTGQGAQWWGMGRELIDKYPIYKESLREAEWHLKSMGCEWSLLEELQRDEQTSKINNTALSTPICVAVQISLVRLLESWGITPTAVTSHSSGEIAAAYAAGALTLRQAMAASYFRAVLAADYALRSVGEKGGMLAAGLGVDEAREYLNKLALGGKAVVACINSPASVTIAGDASAVEKFDEACKQSSVFSRVLRVSTAYHSHQMQPIAQSYLDVLKKHIFADDDDDELDGDKPTAAFSSPVTGGRMTSISKIATPEHWVAGLVQPVEFVKAFTDMVLGDAADQPGGSNVDVVIEVGPHTALGAPIREILSLPEFDGLDIPYYGCLVRKENAADTMRTAAVNLLREGSLLDMHSINFPHGSPALRVLTDLPSYPWNHSHRHWQESRFNRAIRARDQVPHGLLGSLVAGINIEAAATWRNIVRLGENPWLRDHVVQDNIVYPGAGYMCLAIEATKQLVGIQNAAAVKDIVGYRLRDVEFMTALVVPDNADGIEVQTKLSQISDKIIGNRGWKQFEISSVTSDNRWTLHAKGLVIGDLAGSLGVASEPRLKLRPLSRYTRHVDPEDMFSHLRARGIYHGPKFQNTTQVEQDGREPRSVTHMSIADTSVAKDLPREYVLHPTTLDSVLLSAYSSLPGVGALESDAKVPFSIQKLWVSSSIPRETGHVFRCHATMSSKTTQNFRADSLVVDGSASDGGPVLEMQGLVCQSMGSGGSSGDEGSNNSDEQLCTKVEWGPDLSLDQPRALELLKKEHTRAEYRGERDMVMRLRRVCVYFSQDATEGLTPEQVADLESHHVKFYGWMKDQLKLAAAGELAPGCDKWTSDSAEVREREINLASTQSVEGEMVCRLGRVILPLLRKEMPAIEVMMEGRLLYRYYDESFRMAPASMRMSALLRQVVHKNPSARILEIGAGTGGSTRHQLKALGSFEDGGPLAASYHFTDISSGFFEAARTEFAEWIDILKFDKLDVEKDPKAQGFELGSYDIVVAAEVLHATTNMTRTMSNVRSLMKPGGKVLMMETTQDQLDVQFVFGFLSGWWLSEEPERTSSPSLTLPFFDPVLKNVGFSGIDIAIGDCESDDLQTVSVLMSTAVAPQQTAEPVYSEDTVIVISNKAPPPVGFIGLLKDTIQTATGGARPDVVTLEDAKDGRAYANKVCVFLGEAVEPILHKIDVATFEAVKTMTGACKGLVWVTVGGAVESVTPDSSLSQGLLRSLRNEFVGRKYISLDLEGPVSLKLWSSDTAATITKVVEIGFGRAAAEDAPAIDYEYAVRDGVLMVPRIFKDATRNKLVAPESAPDWQDPDAILSEQPLFQQDRPLRLEVGIPGLLDTLAFADYDLDTEAPLAADLVEIEPRAYGLNFRDVMVAMGQLRERIMGFECAGVITRLGAEAQAHGFKVGDRVMTGLLGPIASRAQITWPNAVPLPQGMSFEDAASLPMVFGTAYVGLVDTARFQKGQSVLIHAAAGGVGQAAIQLAKHLGAGEIYATVGSPEKRELIIREYGIPDDHIFNSRDASFAPAVLAATKGRGVDVVLNSLAGPLLQASFEVLAPFGHLVEIGKRDLEGSSLLDMGAFTRVTSYSSLDMMMLMRHRPHEIQRVLTEISRLVQEKALKPVHPVTVFPMRNVVSAFRFLQTGKHTGKIVLSTSPDEVVKARQRVTASTRLRPDASYVLVGGVGGLGRSIAHFLIDHGAKNLILLSRSAGNAEKSGAFVAELRETGCRVKAVSCDVSKAEDLTGALRTCEAEGLPPVRGVIQGAMVLRDSVFERMTLEDWQTCVRPKVNGTRNLHEQWSQPGSLDFFIMLSSCSGILGLVSQASYAAGGAYQDAMAHWRQAHGLPGVAIDLGAVKDVGYVAVTDGVADRLREAGEVMRLEESTVHQTLQAAIAHPLDHPQIVLGLHTGPGPQWDPQGSSQMSRDARFIPLRYRETHGQGGRNDGAGGAEGESLAAKLARADSPAEAADLVGEAIAAKLATIFMLPPDEIDLSQPPAQYGVDSLAAVELRNMLALVAGAEVSIFNIMQSASLAALAVQVVEKSRFVEKS